MIETLNRAVNKSFYVQTENEGRRCNEKVIHNIFFPMRKDVTEVGERDHDVWLLNEEYYCYDYIPSDKALSNIKWSDDTLLFKSDIDEEMQKILSKNYDDNSAKRTDIALYSGGCSAVIIEFLTPGVNLDEHTGDLMEYAQLLAAKSKGKLKKFYGYLLGDKINPNRIGGYIKFPSDKGWFGTERIVEHSSGARLGELYSEILFYEDIVERAKRQKIELDKSFIAMMEGKQ
jgi:hypothetical protein